jgi:hypothetical protein
VLETYLERLSSGPPGAMVRDMDIDWLPATAEFMGFGVRAGGHPGD